MGAQELQALALEKRLWGRFNFILGESRHGRMDDSDAIDTMPWGSGTTLVPGTTLEPCVWSAGLIQHHDYCPWVSRFGLDDNNNIDLPPLFLNAVMQNVSWLWWSMVLKNRSVSARHDVSCDWCGWRNESWTWKQLLESILNRRKSVWWRSV